MNQLTVAMLAQWIKEAEPGDGDPAEWIAQYIFGKLNQPTVIDFEKVGKHARTMISCGQSERGLPALIFHPVSDDFRKLPRSPEGWAMIGKAFEVGREATILEFTYLEVAITLVDAVERVLLIAAERSKIREQ